MSSTRSKALATTLKPPRLGFRDRCRPCTRTRYAGASDRKIGLSWAPGKHLGGKDYLLQMTIPNVYFQVAIAYAILRHNGVDIGKMDFLGPINWIDA
ncbi:MAG TPA: DUF1993 family protein [Candidatus Acidoferrum sp.]|nr:DUF1993 family protein [Candidatus Acidoferrum sp.]